MEPVRQNDPQTCVHGSPVDCWDWPEKFVFRNSLRQTPGLRLVRGKSATAQRKREFPKNSPVVLRGGQHRLRSQLPHLRISQNFSMDRLLSKCHAEDSTVSAVASIKLSVHSCDFASAKSTFPDYKTNPPPNDRTSQRCFMLGIPVSD